MGNGSSAPRYGPGNTVVGEPLFQPEGGFGPEAFPTEAASPDPAASEAATPPDPGYAAEGAFAQDARPPEDPSFVEEPPSTAPNTHPMPAPPAGASPLAPTAVEAGGRDGDLGGAITGEAFGFGYGPNVSTPYPPAPAPIAGYPSAYGPQAQVVAVPPPPVAVRPRRVESSGPSLLTIGAISFVVIGGLTTAGFLVARGGSASDDASDKPIASMHDTEAPAVATVPIEDPNSAAGAIPTEAPKLPKTRPVVTGRGRPAPVPTGRPRLPPAARMPGPAPTPVPTPGPVPPPAATLPPTATSPSPAPPPAATQPSPTDPTQPAGTSSTRHPRGHAPGAPTAPNP